VSETCFSFAARWLTDYNIVTRNAEPRWSKKSVTNMRGFLRPFLETFGDRPLDSLTVSEARAWAATVPAPYVRVVSTMFNDARRDELVASNPFERLRLPGSNGRRDIKPLTEPELLEVAERGQAKFGLTGYGPTIKAIVLTLGYTGIRPGELSALRPESVDGDELDVRESYNGIELKTPKNGRARRVVLPPRAADAIAVMTPAPDSPWLFTSKQGRQLSKESLGVMWRTFRPGTLELYSLRHTAATILLERGASPEDVAHQLGHTDGGKLVRELYGHPDEGNIRERLKAAFRG
jgi:integrase